MIAGLVEYPQARITHMPAGLVPVPVLAETRLGSVPGLPHVDAMLATVIVVPDVDPVDAVLAFTAALESGRDSDNGLQPFRGKCRRIAFLRTQYLQRIANPGGDLVRNSGRPPDTRLKRPRPTIPARFESRDRFVVIEHRNG